MIGTRKVKFELLKIFEKNIVEIIKGAGLNFLFYALNLVIVYVLALIIAKYFGSDVYGRYSIIKSLLILLIIISTLGTNTLATKFAADRQHFYNKKHKSNFVKKSYVLILITSILISGIIFFFKKELSVYFFKDEKLESYFNIFPVLFIAITMHNYNSNLFKGQKRILAFSFLSSFFSNAVFLFSIFLAVYYYQFIREQYLIYGFLASIVVATIVSLFKIFPIRYDKVVKNISSKKILSQSLPMMASASMMYVVFSIDILILGFLETSENVGIYRIVTQITSINTIFLIVYGAVLSPQVSSLFSSKKEVELRQIINKSAKLIFYITLPFLIIILVFSEEILLFFGEPYLRGHSSLLVLCFCQFFYAISGFVDIILNMTGNERYLGRITFLTAILNIILNIVFIPSLGIFGAAISTGISIVLTNMIALFVVYKKLNMYAIYIPFLMGKNE